MKETQNILSSIAKGIFSPVYLLTGTEPYLIDHVAEALMASVVDAAARDFDLSILYGKETSIAHIIESAKRFPMVGERQLIVVREAQYLSKSIDELTPYALHPQPQTVLVICYKHHKIDKRKKVVKTIKEKGVLMETKPLYDNQISSWIVDRAKAHNFQCPPQAAALLTASLGNDLGKLNNALEKLSYSLPQQTTITSDHIERYIGFSKAFNNFELQHALGQRNLSLSLRIIQYMAENPSQNPFVLTLSVVFNFFQKLFIYHGLSNRTDAARVLGVNPYFVKDYQAATGVYSMKQTADVLIVLKKIDLKSKGVGANNLPLEQLLKEMILSIVSV